MMITLLKTSLFMSIAILAFSILAAVFNRPALARWRYLCWIVIALGLLIPARFNILPFYEPEAVTTAREIVLSNVEIPTLVESDMQQAIALDSTNTYTPKPESRTPKYTPHSTQQTESTTISVNWGTVFFVVWAFGFVASVTIFTIRHVMFVRSTKRWSRSDEILDEKLEAVKKVIEIRWNVGIALCSVVDTPIITGFFKPVVLIPKSCANSDTLDLMLAHELVHYKRGDIWARVLMLLARAVHWFNPILLFMSAGMNTECEISCDQTVLKYMGAENRFEYGMAVLNTARNTGKSRAITSPAFASGAKNLKKRLSSIVDAKAMKRWSAVCCAVVLLASTAFAVLLTGCEAKEIVIEKISDAPIDLTPTNELIIYLPPLSDYYLNPIIQEYKFRYPDVNIIIEDFNNSEEYLAYSNLVATELAAGKGPDVIFPNAMYDIDLYKAMDNGTFLNLNDIFAQDEKFNRDDYVSAVFDGAMYKGGQYIVPFSFSFYMQISGKKQLEEIGFDISKATNFVGFMNEVTKALPIAKESSAFEYMFFDHNYLLSLFFMSGIELIDYEKRLVLPNKDELRAFCEAVKPYYETDYSDDEWVHSKNANNILSGQIIFNDLYNMESLIFDASMLKTNGGYEITPIRRMDGGIQTLSHNTTAIRAGSKNQLNAYNFIKLLLSDYVQNMRDKLVGYPIQKNAFARSLKQDGAEIGQPDTGYSPGYDASMFTAIDDEERQAIADINLSVDNFSFYNNTLTAIFMESMQSYFRDEKSYEECVRELENKLKFYLSE